MRVARVGVLGLRNLVQGEVGLDEGVTLLWGPNGAGKTSFLEAICLALAGRSPRTRADRETLAFAADLARVEVDVHDGPQARTFLWSFARAGERRHLVDHSPAGPEASTLRPALAIFLPDRLALVKGPPAGRRAHLDRLAAALWPARAQARRRYAGALAQRNALLHRVRPAAAPPDSLDAGDREMADAAAELIASRAEAVERLAPEFASASRELGLVGEPALSYRPRCRSADADEIARELAERRDSDLARGFSCHGPHLDELSLALDGHELRRYGSQGEQRSALLALLFAERRALADADRPLPVLLLDDVMSELDEDRRALLAARLAEGGGQAIVTATEPHHLPAGCPRREVAVRDGAVLAAVDSRRAAA